MRYREATTKMRAQRYIDNQGENLQDDEKGGQRWRVSL